MEREFLNFVTQRNLPLNVLLLTSSANAFYLLFEQDKYLMLVHLPFHNYWFQNGTWDLPNFNLVQTGSTDLCVVCYSNIP